MNRFNLSQPHPLALLLCGLMSPFVPTIAQAHSYDLCQAYTVSDSSAYGYSEVNNCPLTIAGSFSNGTRRVAIQQWEPAAYRLRVWNQANNSLLYGNIDFDIIGTTERAQYRFQIDDGDTYVVSFQYADPDTIRLEIYDYQGYRQYNELLYRDNLPIPR
jgi:hypothetical protein